MSTAISRLYNFQNDSSGSIPISSSKVDGELDAIISSLNQKVQIKSSAPSNPIDGQTWVDLSQDPPIIKIYDQTNAGWTEATVFGGFDSYSEKTTVVADDMLVINDSEDSDAVKFVKYSTLVNIANDTFFKGVDNAGTGTVDLIKVDTSDNPTIADGFLTATDAAPTDDKGVANKKYVDDNVGFKSWTDKSASYGAQQAATDLIVIACASLAAGKYLYGYTDSASDPTTLRARMSPQSATAVTQSITFPVKKGDYWKCVTDGTMTSVYTMSIGD